jgi:predicted nucleic acid-binding protein
LVIYLDSSALVKLAHEEEHSQALQAWLTDRAGSAMVSSVLVEVEVARALRREDPAALPTAAQVLARLHLVDVSPAIRSAAGAFPTPTLRSLDAVHLATARLSSSSTSDTFVAYDARLLAAAREGGFDVAAPGLAAP